MIKIDQIIQIQKKILKYIVAVEIMECHYSDNRGLWCTDKCSSKYLITFKDLDNANLVGNFCENFLLKNGAIIGGKNELSTNGD